MLHENDSSEISKNNPVNLQSREREIFLNVILHI